MAGNSSVPCLRHLVEPVHAGGGLLADAADARRRCAATGRAPRCCRRRSRSRMMPHSSGSFVGVEVGHLAGAARTRGPCAPAASRRRRRRRSGRGPSRPATPAPRWCTTSTPRASRPSRRTRRCRSGFCDACPSRPTATAAAAWSWVLKMLHDTQRTSAPRSTSVSISTAVCTVMCSEPMMRAPVSGLLARVARAQRHQAGHLLLGEADLLAPELGEGRGPSP